MDTSGTENNLSDDQQNRQAIGLWGSLHTLQLLLGIGRKTDDDIAFVGSSDPVIARHLADAFELDPADDIRHGINPTDCFALVAGDPGFTPDLLQGPREILSLEPGALRSADFKTTTILGLFTHSPGFRSLEQVLQDFGPISSVHFTAHCSEGQGTLHGRLHDAFCVIHALLGTPEMIDAMLVGALDVQSSQPGHHHADKVSDDLFGITGYLSALIRCVPRATATISVSDQLDWQRSLRIMGPSGIIDVMENTITWCKPDGTLLDVGEPLEDPFTFHCMSLAQEISNSTGSSELQLQPERIESIMACCEAARLSCRTRAPESPDKVRDLLGRT
ncbi:MAG: hypothetical protein CMJ33_02490 [Phycisphaerae bacterium]|nr:hypothetical protein [Phycisphaerae bacterium]